MSDIVGEETPTFVYEPEASAGSFVMLIAQESFGESHHPTVDGRMFAEGSISWRELPIPLTLNRTNTAEGQHKTASAVGAICSIWKDGGNVYGRGYFSSDEEGQEARKLIREGVISHVSADVGGVIASEFAESEVPEGVKRLFTRGTILGVTALLHSSFDDTKIAVDGTDSQFAAGKVTEVNDEDETPAEEANETPAEEDAEEKANDKKALTAAAERGWAPPDTAFKNPNLARPTPLTITDDGRVFGHAAVFGTCHVGYKDRCVTPPRSNKNYAYFNVGEVLTAEGAHVPVGRITANTGHASLEMGAQPAKEHYDHTGFAAAYVKAGEDEHGIWFAGVIAPDATDAQVANLRAAGVSGDWRAIDGSLEMVGLLAVNTPGFPVPRAASTIVAGAQTALVAAGIVASVEAATSQELIDQLKVLLSNTVTVYHQAHGFHWNVEGDDFVPYHELFNKIYDDLYESIDPTAENIRKLQGEAPYTLDEFMALRTITESIPGETPESMGTALLSKLEELIGSLKATFAIANGADEQGVANFVADRIDTFQKWAWQLRASVVEGAESMDKEEGDTDLPEAVNASAVEEDCGCDDTEEACADCVGDCADCIEEAKKAKKKVEKTADSFAFRDGRPIEWTTDLDQNFLNGINEKFSDIYDLANQTTQMGSRISMQVQSYAAYLKGVSLDEQNLLDRTLGKPTLPEGSGKEDNDPTPMAYEIQLSLMDLDVLSPI